MKAGGDHKNFVSAALLNSATYNMYYTRLKLLAMTMFNWQGLPDSVSERFLELSLYEQGKALFFWDDKLGYLGLRCAFANLLNVYEEPTQYMAYSINYSKSYSADDCVLIRNNYLMEPTDNIIQQFALRLYEAERSSDVNVKAQKTPLIILCEDNQRLSLKNLYMKYDGNEPIIYGFKNFDPNSINVIKTDAPFICSNLQEYKAKIWQEAMSFLGISSINTEKRERLNIPETVVGNEHSYMSAYTMLKTRQQAAELINSKYNLNISVELRENQQLKEYIQPDDGEVMSLPDSEEDYNGG